MVVKKGGQDAEESNTMVGIDGDDMGIPEDILFIE